MKKVLRFFLLLYTWWLAIFLLQKISFMVFNRAESSTLPTADWFRVLYHGLPHDLSVAAYLCAFPLLVLLFAPLMKHIFKSTISVYNMISLFLILVIGIVDMNLYQYWGYKFDIVPLLSLGSPTGITSSLSLGELLLIFLLLAIEYLGFLWIFRKWILASLPTPASLGMPGSIVAFALLLFSFIPARGGIGVASMGLGKVYFSANIFANHSAVNSTWNMLYSITELGKLKSKFHLMNESRANDLFSKLHPRPSLFPKSIIKENANVLLIILEGFSNKIIRSAGGMTGVTPNLDSLYSESVVFSNFFATGDRSDKGLIGIFSSFPSQPQTTIMSYPSKTQKLPVLGKAFYEQGYETSFYYGGDLNFGNFRSYFTNASFRRLVTRDEFPKSASTQKWGVPDEFVYTRILDDLDSTSDPFFATVFTLSSHEPYDTPDDRVFQTITRDAPCLNAYHYADQCLGKFISEAKNRSWWKNTLVIITSDHGSRCPGNTPSHVREKFAIPMLWLGGAIITDPFIVETFGSQVDVAATLYAQFGFDYQKFTFSKDLLSQESGGYAYYAFNNGFGFFVPSAGMVFDNNLQKFILRSGTGVSNWEDYGKAVMQLSTSEFSRL